MKERLLIIFTLITGMLSVNGLASEDQEKIYLVQIINQLNAIQPLIIAAQKEQPDNLRIQFHYTQYRDLKGKLHNGLLEDVKAIKQGIEEKLHQTAVEPRVIAPINGDYLRTSQKEGNNP